ncbi:MAG: DegQ family serine endoprotease [Desulfobulbaceae bacterium]|nr:DegQ family serine endoprotease [Desulfobulbaceae bacterium]MDY0349922.1 DegQ family serine endoprotease [Desulfobulbaceae bacterium]
MHRPRKFVRSPHLLGAFLCFLAILLATGPSLLAAEDENIALLDRSAKAFASVVKQAGPAVVHVRVEKSVTRGFQQSPFDFFNDPFFERFFGPQFRHPPQEPREFKQRGAGSGFIISPDGYILTNNHVIGEADTITVRLADEREFSGEVVGTDPQSDVALIKIAAKNLPFLPLGDSDNLEVGEWVIAIGSPFELNQTVTVGVVSAKGRNRIGISDYENFIQTDAAINPGNSGGPLLNIHGEAIGMNTAIFSRSGGYMGIGFAIPINMAKVIEQQLRAHGKVVRGWLGVVIQDINEDLAKSFGLEHSRGALVSETAEKSPAAEAGLQQGDVIIAVNGTEVTNVSDLRNRIALIPPGTKVDLQVIRDAKKQKFTVTIAEQPADLGQAGISGDGSLNRMGLTLQDLTEELAAQFGYSRDQGVLIAGVEPGSPAELAGLQAGQLIEEVNKQRVRSLDELRTALERSQAGDKVLLRIRAGEYSRYVVLQVDK